MKDCEPIITVRGLANHFGEQVIHQDLDLTVCRGEIIGVITSRSCPAGRTLRVAQFAQ